jgi:hypothetical protein
MSGPAELCHGARWAVLGLLALPAFILVAFILWVIQHDVSHLLFLLPGFLILPIVALIPALMRKGVPLSLPNEEAKSAGRGLKMFAVMIPSAILSGLAVSANAAGWFQWLLLGELIVVVPLYFGLRARIARLRWPSME